jgi:hypothetical protein
MDPPKSDGRRVRRASLERIMRSCCNLSIGD